MNQINVETLKRQFETSEDLFGIFFEDINRVGDGGLYPEMLRNRSFEDSIVPEGCELVEHGKYFITPTGYKCAFNNGEGLDAWIESLSPTQIPAWYISKDCTDVHITLDMKDTLNKNRRSSLVIDFCGECTESSVYNIGYSGMNIEEGKEYSFFIFCKTSGSGQRAEVSLRSNCGNHIYASNSIYIEDDVFRRYDCIFKAESTDRSATFHITSKSKGSITVGFVSLMPVDTYNRRVNGLRKDIVELLKNMNASFFRFPGGCIVEGITRETALRFKNTIGPIWERPSHWLMWFYRTSNGLGFHEYLQLCEDINLSPMYVINCGMTCQHRKPDYFEEQLTDIYLQDAINAIEYATAPVDTYWGGVRDANGHPEPFSLKYIEIGNENYGEEYNKRYLKFYTVLKERFPDIILISNTHIELEGFPAEVVDEHFYNDTEFFASKHHKYDDYDRNGPKIFVGEYAVTNNRVNASLYSALGEAVFLTGLERNQDIVTMSCYAPLFMNASYTSWYPNLIVFNNHESFGIPSYYMLQMMGQNRGDYVIGCDVHTRMTTECKFGRAGLFSERKGTEFRNVTINEEIQNIPAAIISGAFDIQGSTYRAQTNDAWCLLGNEDMHDYIISADVRFGTERGTIRISAWNERLESVGDVFQPYWSLKRIKRFNWVIENGESYIEEIKRSVVQYTSQKVKVAIDYESVNTMEMAVKNNTIECRLNGYLINTHKVALFPVITASAVIDKAMNEAIIKIINIDKHDEPVRIILDQSVYGTAKGYILKSDDKDDTNSFANKTRVSSVEFTLSGVSAEFSYIVPKYSFTVLRVRLR